MANAGIMHLSATVGGRPYCNTNRSVMSTTEAKAYSWKTICKKCEAVRLRYEAKRSAKT